MIVREPWVRGWHVVLCACGRAYWRRSASSAESTAAWHRETGNEGNDHVMSIEWRATREEGRSCDAAV